MTYFIQASPSKYIKIGKASEPELRLKGLQTNCPDELTLLGCVEESELSEKEAHSRFKRYRIRGEWFWPGPELEEFIQDRFATCISPASGADDRQFFTFAEPELCSVSSERMKAALQAEQIKEDRAKDESRKPSRPQRVLEAAATPSTSDKDLRDPHAFTSERRDHIDENFWRRFAAAHALVVGHRNPLPQPEHGRLQKIATKALYLLAKDNLDRRLATKAENLPQDSLPLRPPIEGAQAAD